MAELESPELAPVSKLTFMGRFDPWLLLIIGADAAAVKHPKLAQIGLELCELTHAWLSTGRPQGMIPGRAYEDACALIRSSLSGSVIAGATCGRYLRFARPDGDDWLTGVFAGSRARSRSLMLMDAIDLRPPLSPSAKRLITLGLRDRSREVRDRAAGAFCLARSTDLLDVAMEARAVETHAPLAQYLEQVQSMVRHGFWIGPIDENATRLVINYAINESGFPNGLAHMLIPAAAFKTLREAEVVRRIGEASDIRKPGFRDASAWLQSVFDNRH